MNPYGSSLWNPEKSIKITPKEYEEQVVEWLKNSGVNLKNFKIPKLQ